MNFFEFKDHKRIELTIRENVNCDWIITYDVAPEIKSIYAAYSMNLYDLNYSVSKKCRASELMIFKDGIEIPSEELLQSQNIKINIRPYNPHNEVG